MPEPDPTPNGHARAKSLKAVEPLLCRCGERLGSQVQDGRWIVLLAWTATGQLFVRDARIVCWKCEKVTWFQARKARDVAPRSKA